MIIILKMDFNLLRARQTIHQKRKETQTQMSTQFRMSKENSTSRAQSRLSRSDQPQGMFTHRSRSQHSMNVDHLTCHTSPQFQHQTGHNPLKTQSTFFAMATEFNAIEHRPFLVSLTFSTAVLQWLKLPLDINQISAIMTVF